MGFYGHALGHSLHLQSPLTTLTTAYSSLVILTTLTDTAFQLLSEPIKFLLQQLRKFCGVSRGYFSKTREFFSEGRELGRLLVTARLRA